MARWTSIATLAVCCALLAGCGSSSPSAKPPYVAQANRICATGQAQLRRLSRPTTPEQAIDYLPAVLAIMHTESGQLKTLDPHPASAAELTAAVATMQRLATLLARFLHTLKTGIVELTSFAQVQTQGNVLRSQIDAHFRHAGLPACVQ